MKYLCKTKGDKSLAVIEDDNGKEIDTKECVNKFDAMTMRDKAMNAKVAAFDHIDNPPAAKKAKPEPAVKPVEERPEIDPRTAKAPETLKVPAEGFTHDPQKMAEDHRLDTRHQPAKPVEHPHEQQKPAKPPAHEPTQFRPGSTKPKP